jgi:hypothetical protein
MLEHVGADTRFGFGVGGRVGVETHGFGGPAVGHWVIVPERTRWAKAIS